MELNRIPDGVFLIRHGKLLADDSALSDETTNHLEQGVIPFLQDLHQECTVHIHSSNQDRAARTAMRLSLLMKEQDWSMGEFRTTDWLYEEEDEAMNTYIHDQLEEYKEGADRNIFIFVTHMDMVGKRLNIDSEMWGRKIKYCSVFGHDDFLPGHD